jgi:hypothetical protein
MAESGNPYGVRPGLATGLGTIGNFGPSQQYMPGGSSYQDPGISVGSEAASRASADDQRKRMIQQQIRELERTLAALKSQL